MQPSVQQHAAINSCILLIHCRNSHLCAAATYFSKKFLSKHTFSSVSGVPCWPTTSTTICALTQISPRSWILTMAVQLFNETRLCIQHSFTQCGTQMTTLSGIRTPEGMSRRWSTAQTREMDNETEEFIPLHKSEYNFHVQKNAIRFLAD
jgi:hypothetical protein